MTYDLLIGQRGYSSWSLRGWLPFDAFDIPYTLHKAALYNDGFREQAEAFAGGRTVPAAKAPTGERLTDSLSIAWHLTEAFAEKRLLPQAGPMRGMALNMISEMHSGFSALRSTCPMNLFTAWADVAVSDDVQADLARLDHLWGAALEASGGPFLFGDYTLVDAFYAPVAARIAGYGLKVNDSSQGYVKTQLNHGSMRRWRAMAYAENLRLDVYDQPYARIPYPAPTPLTAKAVDTGPAENTACPYSGKEVMHFLELNGRTFGFCNAFCRDKTVADPEAWPKFMSLT